jgi:hypothetical protein
MPAGAARRRALIGTLRGLASLPVIRIIHTEPRRSLMDDACRCRAAVPTSARSGASVGPRRGSLLWKRRPSWRARTSAVGTDSWPTRQHSCDSPAEVSARRFEIERDSLGHELRIALGQVRPSAGPLPQPFAVLGRHDGRRLEVQRGHDSSARVAAIRRGQSLETARPGVTK